MANKKNIMDKLSALNLAVPTKTRVHSASAGRPAVPHTAEAAETGKTIDAAPIVVEAKHGGTVAVAEIAPPVFSSNKGACTFTLFVDNMAALMKIREEFQNNFLNINSMMLDSYQKTLTITFDAMRHNYGQFVESLKFLMPKVIH
ncbi:MAG: hypothetical protein HQK99_07750 [Nitrospirae bacterium]|nr:hypothetical protein [Nitrospirota bacterium]